MLLAIDTSGPLCSTCLFDPTVGKAVSVRSDDLGRGHAEHLMGMIDEEMNRVNVGWDAITALAVTTGPGSFTGLRVGISAARGLALALDCPCAGVSVFEALAEAFGRNEPLCIAMDARRNEVWVQCFDAAGNPSSEPAAINVTDAATSLLPGVTRIAGSAAPMLAQLCEGLDVVDTGASPPVEALARIGANRKAMDKPRPLYLRAPDAKPQVVRVSAA